MGLYSKQGLFNGYKKNNVEREALDYYATPPQEVTNILEIIGLNLDHTIILEPAAGGGHMVKGILDYIYSQGYESKLWKLVATDVQERTVIDDYNGCIKEVVKTGSEYDFLSDDYPFDRADYVIMNPPYSTIEPFVIRGLEIAQKGLLLLGRIQFLEGKSRYENILKDNPPSDVYIYVDRIKCYKNGDFTQTESSAQAYAWFYWDREKAGGDTIVHWIRRAD